MDFFLRIISKLGKGGLIVSITRSLPERRVCLRVAMGRPQLVFGRKGMIITPSHWALSIFVRFPKATVVSNSSIAQKLIDIFNRNSGI